MIFQKFILSITILSLVSINFIVAQNEIIENGTVTYIVESKSKFRAIMDKLVLEDGLRDSSALNGMIESINLLTSSLKPVSFELKIQGHKSRFKIEDSLDPDFTSNLNMNRLLARMVGTIYIDESDKSILKVREVNNQEYFIDYTTEYYEWDITEEYKMVNGYKCTKATCPRLNPTEKETPIVAWFTEDIKNSIGPAGYGGLPGLIMELTTNGLTTYILSDIYQPESSTYEIKIPEPLETYDIQEFPAVLKKLNTERKSLLGY